VWLATTREFDDRIEAAQEGEDLDDAQPVLNFGSYGELSRLLSPKNLELHACSTSVPSGCY